MFCTHTHILVSSGVLVLVGASFGVVAVVGCVGFSRKLFFSFNVLWLLFKFSCVIVKFLSLLV